MRYQCVLLFGAPGSGKGTQGKIIGTIPGFFHTACGDIFRSLDLTSDMGRIFWEYSSRGQLVPDEFTVKLWKQYINGLELINQFRPGSEVLVLDGIPRNVEQAKLLEDTLDVRKIIHLQCADLAKMVERLVVYDVETKPVLEYYPEPTIERIDATMSQIRVLSEIVRILVPLKETIDKEHVADGEKIKADSTAAIAAMSKA
jgi:adenylate kinase